MNSGLSTIRLITVIGRFAPAKQAPIDLGYVDLNTGKLHPVHEHALPGRSSTPAHLITYAWMGAGTS